MNWVAWSASFLGTGVEFVEALTIVIAVGTVRGWRSSLAGALAAAAVLAILVAIIGAPLIRVVQIGWVQVLVGMFMLLFGIRWLRKAILRYGGLKALHDEAASFAKEVERQRRAGGASDGIDRFAFATTFSGTFLEGLEAIFIVITVGLSAKAMGASVFGAAVATILVSAAGLALRGPLSAVPENTMKYVVGVMLTSFGAFWTGEGLGVAWPGDDFAVVGMAAGFLVFSWLIVRSLRRSAAQPTGVSGPEVHSA